MIDLLTVAIKNSIIWNSSTAIVFIKFNSKSGISLSKMEVLSKNTHLLFFIRVRSIISFISLSTIKLPLLSIFSFFTQSFINTNRKYFLLLLMNSTKLSSLIRGISDISNNRKKALWERK